MDKIDRIEATNQIIEQSPEAKILMVTSFVDDDKVYPAREAGATSYILKTSKATAIAEAIRKTALGESVFEQEVTSKMMAKMRSDNNPELHTLLKIGRASCREEWRARRSPEN